MHLKRNSLHYEQIAFTKKIIQKLPENSAISDSLHLQLSLCYYLIKDTLNCKKTLAAISHPFISSLNNELLFALNILTNRTFIIDSTFLKTNTTPIKQEIQTAHIATSILSRKKYTINEALYSDTLLAHKTILSFQHSYLTARSYSPFKSALLSAILPGLGKVYLGYPRQATTSCVSNLLLAAQMIESYIKTGPKSTPFIITASLFGVFYTGNIWGTALLAKKKKKDHLNQIDYEIMEYYRSVVGLYK